MPEPTMTKKTITLDYDEYLALVLRPFPKPVPIPEPWLDRALDSAEVVLPLIGLGFVVGFGLGFWFTSWIDKSW